MLCPVGRECSRSDCSTRRGGSRLRGNLCCISIQKIALPVLGHREPWETDYYPTATSRVTHVAQCVVFRAVMVDAAKLDAVLELDVWGKERVEGGSRG